LVAIQKDGAPYFTITDGGVSQRTRGLGIVSGSATLNSTQRAYQSRGTRCIRGKAFGKCQESVSYVENCIREEIQTTVNMSITRAADRKIVYSVVRPVKTNRTWCDGSGPGDSGAGVLLPMLEEAAAGIEKDVAPHMVENKIQLAEQTEGFTKEAVKPFRAAVKISKRDLAGSCSQWQDLSAKGERAASLTFNLGVCAEAAKDYSRAAQLYGEAQTLWGGGSKDAASATTRVRTLMVAQRSVASQQQQEAAAARAARDAEQAAKRRADQAVANQARAERDKAAAAVAARAQQRQGVAQKYGAGVADDILSGRVKTGMSMQQVKAAIGAPQRVQRISEGEEQWIYPSRRVVFLSGRVTFVR
jgi:hypothetical protein